ncbi:MAG: hypothetical protein IH942_06235, partial [Acidobacteria bacterium]|nr:hypothetical protein [Acidobacteriota bacterium]
PKFDRDGTAIKLVGNEVLNRAKKLLLHIQKQAEHDRQQRPSPVPAHSVLTDSLGLGAVAWPILKGQQRKKALSIGDQVTLQEATDYLRGAPGNHNLISSFGTDDRKQNLQKAIESFRTAADQWAAGHLRDPKLNWLVPEPLIDGRNRFYEGWLEHVSDPWRSRLEGCQRANRWLPLLSVEAVNVLKKMSAADYAFISTVLGRASLLIGDEGALKPWRGTFRPELGKLPVGYLYQVDATNKLDRILSRLTYAGCQNIGHLVILDQEAWQLSRDVSLSEWGKLK